VCVHTQGEMASFNNTLFIINGCSYLRNVMEICEQFSDYRSKKKLLAYFFCGLVY